MTNIYVDGDGTVREQMVLRDLEDVKDACLQMIAAAEVGDWGNVCIKALVGGANLSGVSKDLAIILDAGKEV